MLVSEAIERSDEDRADAFTRLLDRGLDAHYRLASVILGDPVEAEDAVHDAAVVAWRGFGRCATATGSRPGSGGSS